MPLTGSQVVTSADVDSDVAAIRAVCPRLRIGDVRQFSYANLLYERLRSPMSHEYRTGAHTVPHKMTDLVDVPVSYFNWIFEPGTVEKPPSRKGLPIRHIHFHVEWLASITRQVGKAADATKHPLPQPARWWIHRRRKKSKT